MLKIIGRRWAFRAVSSNNDDVMAHYPLPAGCTLSRVDHEVHIVGVETVKTRELSAYGMSGFVIPVPDPDTVRNVDTLWDQFVPKDTGFTEGAFDIDENTQQAAPEYEFGVPAMEGLFGVAMNSPVEFYRRRKMISFANRQSGFRAVDSSDDLFIPTDYVKGTIKKQVKAERHSHIMFGFSSPDTLSTQVVAVNTIAETEWPMMTFLETMLDDAAMFAMGLVEAGAEAPYNTIAAFVANLIEAPVFEETAGRFAPATWNVTQLATFQVDVPGRFSTGGTITSE